MTGPADPFWRTKSLDAMDQVEWESLCDGCGKCCLIRLEDEDTGDIHTTDVACKLLDGQSCQCSDYANRKTFVPDCVKLTPEGARTLGWLPRTCAYRLIAEGKDLFDWHPLVSSDPDSVHRAGMSVQGRTTSETRVKTRNLVRRIKVWPGEG
jgi:uncharacterized protein